MRIVLLCEVVHKLRDFLGKLESGKHSSHTKRSVRAKHLKSVFFLDVSAYIPDVKKVTMFRHVCFMYFKEKKVLINEKRFFGYIQVTFRNYIFLVHLSNEFSEPNLDFNCT